MRDANENPLLWQVASGKVSDYCNVRDYIDVVEQNRSRVPSGLAISQSCVASFPGSVHDK
jgi:hypothetical protein